MNADLIEAPTTMLMHYSYAPLSSVRSADQEDRPNFKPRGIWLSTEGEGGWRQWCESKGFALDRLACVHDVTLSHDAAIIRIQNAGDLEAFENEYGSPSAIVRGLDMIEWIRVAKRYQGIAIIPYLWDCRCQPDRFLWYYPWDCASACIWDADAIKSIQLRS